MASTARNLNLIWPRRVCQLLFLSAWYYLFLRTYVAADNLIRGNPLPDFFLRTDPLAGLVSSVAARAFAHELVYWLPMIASTLIVGRAFCGWICPLGTWLDICDHGDRLLRRLATKGKIALLRNKRDSFRRHMQWKFYLLAVGLVATAFSVSLLGHIDPLCVMTRVFSFGIFPMLAELESSLGASTRIFGYAFTKGHFFQFNLVAALTFLLVLYLNRFSRRFWCRNLCPLGALYGTVGRLSFVKLTVDQTRCDSCLKCAVDCKMAALDFPASRQPIASYRKDECIQCYTCVDICRQNCISIGFHPKFWRESVLPPVGQPAAAAAPSPKTNNAGLVTRRGLLQSACAGVATAMALRIDPRTRAIENRALLRPPFARVDDKAFMDLCIRCGMCIRVCKTNTLQPAYLSAAAEGVMTPVLSPEIAGCDPECTACGQVCPTNAIVPFSKDDKYTMKHGTAKLELGRCIGWTGNHGCNECAKICPTQAIKVTRERGVLKPIRIAYDECTGCALCVKRCNEIVANGSACVVSNTGRGLPTNLARIRSTLAEKEAIGKSYLPTENDSQRS